MKIRSVTRHLRHPAIRGLCFVVLMAALSVVRAQEPAPAPLPTSAPANDAQKPPEPKKENTPDAVAARFLTSCSGCHTLTDVKLTGPGLANAMKWTDAELKAGIKKMEAKVGPIKDEDIAALAAFIKDTNAPKRIAAEQEKMQARLLAKMDPPDAGLGKALFAGKKGLKNGGLSCASCHAVHGEGGNLGPDLTGLFKKIGGKQPLVSAITNAKYKIMEPHYARHPVTLQEALHLTEYFSKIDPAAPVAAPPPFAEAGAGLAGVLLAGITLVLRAARKQRGRDTQLVRRRK
ncbi:MAG: c-type cytochrome [Verrucomicrobia bacterium]|nr:c-type cytochrome [Verrucomicrobiota bacterium]